MSSNDNLHAFHEMAKAFNLSPSDLDEVAARLSSTHHVPTIGEYHEKVKSRCTPKSLPTYGTHFRRLVDEHGDVALDRIDANQIEALRDKIVLEAATKKVEAAERTGRPLRSYEIDAHGYGAGENFVRATRFFFEVAKKAKLVHTNPAKDVKVPKRLPTARRPLVVWELEEVATIWCTTGDDPELDALMFEFHRKIGARREGGLNLRLGNLDSKRGAVTVTEKFGISRDMPLDVDFINRLRAFARARGATKPSDHVFRSKTGRRISRKRYENIYNRIDKHTTWSQALDVGVHWIRHTTLDDIRAVSDPRVAAAYAGHDDDDDESIIRYTKITFETLCAAFEAIFGDRVNA